MKQILTTLTALFTFILLASTASAGIPSAHLVELAPTSRKSATLTAHDALGMVADCYSGYGGYGGGYSYAPVRRTYYRGGGGVSVNVGRGYGGYRGLPYGYGGRGLGYGGGFGPGFAPVGRGYRGGYGGGSGVGLFIRF